MIDSIINRITDIELINPPNCGIGTVIGWSCDQLAVKTNPGFWKVSGCLGELTDKELTEYVGDAEAGIYNINN